MSITEVQYSAVCTWFLMSADIHDSSPKTLMLVCSTNKYVLTVCSTNKYLKFKNIFEIQLSAFFQIQ